jgi:hypothetical protein
MIQVASKYYVCQDEISVVGFKMLTLEPAAMYVKLGCMPLSAAGKRMALSKD